MHESRIANPPCITHKTLKSQQTINDAKFRTAHATTSLGKRTNCTWTTWNFERKCQGSKSRTNSCDFLQHNNWIASAFRAATIFTLPVQTYQSHANIPNTAKLAMQNEKENMQTTQHMKTISRKLWHMKTISRKLWHCRARQHEGVQATKQPYSGASANTLTHKKSPASTMRSSCHEHKHASNNKASAQRQEASST